MKILTTKVIGQELAKSINIHPRQNNRSRSVEDPEIKNKIKEIVAEWMASRFQGAFDRTLESFDFTIESLQRRKASAELGEVCRAREEFCDYFNGNSMKTDPAKMQKYYDEFAILARN